MQNARQLIPFFSLAVLVSVAEASPEAAAEQLRSALTRELTVLQSAQDSASAAAALPQLNAVLEELAAMERSYEAEKALWEYLDNTEGAKMPLVELLQCLTIEFMRLEDAAFFNNEGLRTALAPQLLPPSRESAE